MKEYNVILNGEKFDVTVESMTDAEAEKVFAKKLESVSKREMKYCQKCGKEIIEEAVICPNCGCSQGNIIQNVTDSSSFGWSFLGFCIPIIGLILYLIWKDNLPLRAKSVGKGALISVVTAVLFYVLIFTIAIGLSNA